MRVPDVDEAELWVIDGDGAAGLADKPVAVMHVDRKAVEAAKGGDMVMQDAAAGVGAVATNTQFVEDFSREAAVALQIIYSLSGDFESAKDVTAKWLVI